ncbi:MAG: hypothetical protein DCF19_12765 [Pseudanabaena frigida]|uniref:Uncharacterized protein n=1 Tax=Pseudanabaena frigida TaxID=945775 RepID=A0A2W4XXS3_9CYAN|nr:MAG: hypothetical protein DCF19_12765 [Pseudanabaena frigida]
MLVLNKVNQKFLKMVKQSRLTVFVFVILLSVNNQLFAQILSANNFAQAENVSITNFRLDIRKQKKVLRMS